MDILEWKNARAAMEWQQGEHVTLIGPTGCGKTTFVNAVLPLRDYLIFLGTKRKDSTQEFLRSEKNFRYLRSPSELNPDISRRFVAQATFPKVNADELFELHREFFRAVLMAAYRQGSWTIIVDECRYIADHLKLTKELQLLWLQGRSQGNTLVAGTQRPRYIPLEAYDQATHLVFWRDADESNVKRCAELAGINKDLALEVVPNLGLNQFFYTNTRTGKTFVSKVEVSH